MGRKIHWKPPEGVTRPEIIKTIKFYIKNDLGPLTPHDLPILDTMARQKQIECDAYEVLAKEGLTQESPRGEVAHPCVKIAKDAANTYTAHARELGLTRRAAKIVKGSNEGNEELTEFEKAILGS